MALLKRRYLFEADDDGGDASSAGGDNATDTSSDTSSDNTDTSNDDSSDDNQSDDSSDDNQNDDSGNDNSDDSGDDEEDEDYSIDAEPDDDDTGDDDSGDSDDGDEESSDTDSEEKELDRQMFDTLTDSEKRTKINTLKKLFIEMYSNCDNMIDRFNTIQVDAEEEEFGPAIKRILNILYDLKEYISFYVVNTFDNNSYIENDITFNRYLTTLNGIKLIAQQLEKIHNKNEEEKNGVKR